jgi:acyl carrier protein
MEQQKVLSQLTTIFRQLFHDQQLTIDESTSATDIPGWDSLAHIQVIHSVEKEFGYRFTAVEIRRWRSVGDIIRSIQERTARRSE